MGDSAIRNVANSLRTTVGGFMSENSGLLDSLTSVGITTNLDGQLEIDDEVLTQTLTSSFDEVGRLFSGEAGIATITSNLLETFSSDTGPLETRSDTLQARIDDISDRRDVLEQRLVVFEERTRAQFTALDALIGELNSTSTFLSQQLSALPNANQNN